jgi:phosphopantetheine adenylyltransferase
MIEDAIQNIENLLSRFELLEQNQIILTVIANTRKSRILELEQRSGQVDDLKESLQNLDINLHP